VEYLPNRVRQAIAGTDFNTNNLSALIQAAAANTAAAYKKVPGITNEVVEAAQYAVKQSYVRAFQVVYYTALGFALLAIISALCVKDIDPARKNYEKAVLLENENAKVFSDKGYDEVVES
jgi:hypothetical protein